MTDDAADGGGGAAAAAGSDGAGSMEATGGGADEAARAIRFCAGFVEASCELTSALPATEARLHAMLSGQLVICRANLRLASRPPRSPVEEREHLARASKAVGAAFRLHQRYTSQACRCARAPRTSRARAHHASRVARRAEDVRRDRLSRC